MTLKARKRMIHIVGPTIVECNQQCSWWQYMLPPTSGKYFRNGNNVVMSDEESETIVENICSKREVHITAGPTHVSRIKHTVKHDDGERVRIAKAVINSQKTQRIKQLL